MIYMLQKYSAWPAPHVLPKDLKFSNQRIRLTRFTHTCIQTNDGAAPLDVYFHARRFDVYNALYMFSSIIKPTHITITISTHHTHTHTHSHKSFAWYNNHNNINTKKKLNTVYRSFIAYKFEISRARVIMCVFASFVVWGVCAPLHFLYIAVLSISSWFPSSKSK